MDHERSSYIAIRISNIIAVTTLKKHFGLLENFHSFRLMNSNYIIRFFLRKIKINQPGAGKYRHDLDFSDQARIDFLAVRLPSLLNIGYKKEPV